MITEIKSMMDEIKSMMDEIKAETDYLDGIDGVENEPESIRRHLVDIGLALDSIPTPQDIIKDYLITKTKKAEERYAAAELGIELSKRNLDMIQVLQTKLRMGIE